MKIITYNVNGIRAALRKGLDQWLSFVDPDVICLQEVKAMRDQVDLSVFETMGYHILWHPAEKKGYAGVAILSKTKPDEEVIGIGIDRYDVEGRFLLAQINGVSIINAYHPSGSMSPARQQFKLEWLVDFEAFVRTYMIRHPKMVLCGDFNVCHEAIDIHNPMANQNTPGFTPVERAWFSHLLSLGFTDAFRSFNPDPHHYTWWSYMAKARPRNLGWRIDYHLVSEAVSHSINRCVILKEAMHSDHAPVLLELRDITG